MDKLLFEYLISGKAWLLIGSGPSAEMGYPSWEKLASIAVEAVSVEEAGADVTVLKVALEKHDYPRVFQEATRILGGPRLRQVLSENLKPSRPGRIYEIIARWPIPVYMTTNYDDELHNSLASLGQAYIPYSNSEDHLSLMNPELSGAIFKLHGDLRSEEGLILTTDQYRAINEASKWEYWRTKMTSVFQMNRVIVIGHSLSDPNIKHVLEAAKKGAGVLQPVIWIAPNVPSKERRELLEKYRIRVIPYEDKDGQHRNLLRLIESLNEFIPPRIQVRMQEQIEKVTRSSKEPAAAAPGFFVFNEFIKKEDFEEKRIDIVKGAIESALPEIRELGRFTLEKALEVAGWPKSVKPDGRFISEVRKRAIEQEILLPVGDEFEVTDKALRISLQKRATFEHMRGRFRNSLVLRIKREFPDLNDQQAALISSDIDACLTEYFKEGGLSLASVLFSRGRPAAVPGSIIPFITAAATKYDNLTMRQAFFKTSVDAFVHAESPEIDYLGRISQGFFAFHGLGVFGDVAIERIRLAKETVWLVDSDTQIRVLALGTPVNMVYRDCLTRLKSIGLRFFTTASLLDETREHLWFANKVIERNGANSADVFAAARGEVPYRKSNLFLEGFIRWRDAGNPSNWEAYLYQVFGQHKYSDIDIKSVLGSIGIEVVELKEWPGFSSEHYNDVEENVHRIAAIWEQTQQQWLAEDTEVAIDPYKKARPEAEAYIIVRKEREGIYYIISEPGRESSSWFISNTSILNMLETESRLIITWQPEAFLSFASTLCDITESQLAEQAFERLLLGLAQSGLNLLDDDTIARVFGNVIDQAKLDISQLRQEYEETLQTKYGESLESVLARISSTYYPLAATQLATEIAQAEAEQRRAAEIAARKADERAAESEKELQRLQRYRSKLLRKQSRAAKARKKKRKGKKK